MITSWFFDCKDKEDNIKMFKGLKASSLKEEEGFSVSDRLSRKWRGTPKVYGQGLFDKINEHYQIITPI